MTLHRSRTCESCGKKLGGTVGRCYDCGGEKPSPSRKERLRNAEIWKSLLGIERELILDAHDYGDDDE